VGELRFSPRRARYVALEEWHSEAARALGEGRRYVLEIPFSSEKELLMDILKHGAAVEVLGPKRCASRCATGPGAARIVRTGEIGNIRRLQPEETQNEKPLRRRRRHPAAACAQQPAQQAAPRSS
jgi:hypothetical protein